MIQIKRAYDPASKDDGHRYLVERLWPRGIKKTDLPLDAWLKDVSPSPALRKWFSHDPAKWTEFQHRYRSELDANPDAWKPILEASHHGHVTLIYAARDTEHNSALLLKNYLDAKKS